METNGKKVTLDQARMYVKNYTDEDASPSIKTTSMLIEKAHLEKILVQEQCEFVRFYMAKTKAGDQGQYTLVIVGTNADRNDLINGSDPQIYQELGLCPPSCGGGGILDA